MCELTSLPNIGRELAEKIKSAGINSIREFKNLGAEKVFLRIAEIDKGACINMLYTLEGAIQGIRWHNITLERKQELKIFFNQL